MLQIYCPDSQMATSQLRARDRVMLGTLAAVTVTGLHNALFDAFTLSGGTEMEFFNSLFSLGFRP